MNLLSECKIFRNHIFNKHWKYMRSNSFMIHFPVLWDEHKLGCKRTSVQDPFICFLAIRPWSQYLMYLNINFLICKTCNKYFSGFLKVTLEKSVSTWWEKKKIAGAFWMMSSIPQFLHIAWDQTDKGCYKTEIIKIYSVRLKDQERWLKDWELIYELNLKNCASLCVCHQGN